MRGSTSAGLKIRRRICRYAELFFAVAFATAGIICFLIGWDSREHLFEVLADSLGGITSESGMFFFGGIALFAAGLALYFLAPSGVVVDREQNVVRTWRGVAPKLMMKEIPFDQVEHVRLVRRQIKTKSGIRITFHTKLVVPEREIQMDYDRELEALRERATKLSEALGVPLKGPT